jgi:hypothetical protein
MLAMLLVFQLHAATVHADNGTIEITLHNDSASVRVTTPGRAFQLDLDSLTLAMWADTAAALTGPRKGAKETEYPAARLATSLIAMAIIRLSTDSSSSYAFAATGYGGLTGRLTLPYDSARRLFAVMRAPPLADSEGRVFDSTEVNQKAQVMSFVRSAYSLDVPKGTSASRVNPIAFEFVVDTAGQIEPGTFHVVSTADRGEVELISEQWLSATFRPGPLCDEATRFDSWCGSPSTGSDIDPSRDRARVARAGRARAARAGVRGRAGHRERQRPRQCARDEGQRVALDHVAGRLQHGGAHRFRGDGDVVLSTDPAFTGAAEEVLVHTKFEPAVVDGHRITSRTQEPFSFRLTSP